MRSLQINRWTVHSKVTRSHLTLREKKSNLHTSRVCISNIHWSFIDQLLKVAMCILQIQIPVAGSKSSGHVFTSSLRDPPTKMWVTSCERDVLGGKPDLLSLDGVWSLSTTLITNVGSFGPFDLSCHLRPQDRVSEGDRIAWLNCCNWVAMLVILVIRASSEWKTASNSDWFWPRSACPSDAVFIRPRSVGSIVVRSYCQEAQAD